MPYKTTKTLRRTNQLKPTNKSFLEDILILTAFLMGMHAQAVTLGEWEFDLNQTVSYQTNNQSTSKIGAAISKYNGGNIALIIPSKLMDQPVVSIRDSAKFLSPWDRPFTNSINSVVFSTNLIKIGNYAFRGCISLTNVIFPESIKNIGTGAFAGCPLSDLRLPGVQSIGTTAFEDCTSLTNIVFGGDLNSVGDGAFWGCTNLQSVEFGNGVKTISEGIFYNSKKLSQVTFPSTLTNISINAFGWCGITNLTIPEGTNAVSIGDYAFNGCTNLLNINIPKLQSVGIQAFASCSGLGEINLPQIRTIGIAAFNYCPNLTNISFGGELRKMGDDQNESYSTGTVWGWSSNNIKTITLGLGIPEIGHRWFKSLNRLTNINIPTSVSQIGVEAFANTGLANINVPASVTLIKDSAFAGSQLVQFTIGDQLLQVSPGTFAGCAVLTNVVYGKNISSIGESAW